MNVPQNTVLGLGLGLGLGVLGGECPSEHGVLYHYECGNDCMTVLWIRYCCSHGEILITRCVAVIRDTVITLLSRCVTVVRDTAITLLPRCVTVIRDTAITLLSRCVTVSLRSSSSLGVRGPRLAHQCRCLWVEPESCCVEGGNPIITMMMTTMMRTTVTITTLTIIIMVINKYRFVACGRSQMRRLVASGKGAYR